MIATETLGSAALAELWKCDRRTAHRRLLRLEEQYGSAIVGRRGKQGALYTTREAILRVCPEFQAPEPNVDDKIAELRTLIASIERRLRKLESKTGTL